MKISGQKFDPKNNSIGILRLTLAVSVVFSHSYELGGYGHDFISVIAKQKSSVGSIAVDCFFVCSGYLQTLSAYHLNQFPHWIYFILSICFTLPLAILSWHFIEKPSLKLKNLFGKTI